MSAMSEVFDINGNRLHISNEGEVLTETIITITIEDVSKLSHIDMENCPGSIESNLSHAIMQIMQSDYVSTALKQIGCKFVGLDESRIALADDYAGDPNSKAYINFDENGNPYVVDPDDGGDECPSA